MSDKIFRVSGDWSLASDPLQWILMRKTHPVSFVRSTKEILARCMRDKGTPPEDAQRLLDGLPATFDEWLLKAADSVFSTPEGFNECQRLAAGATAAQCPRPAKRTMGLRRGSRAGHKGFVICLLTAWPCDKFICQYAVHCGSPKGQNPKSQPHI